MQNKTESIQLRRDFKFLLTIICVKSNELGMKNRSNWNQNSRCLIDKKTISMSENPLNVLTRLIDCGEVSSPTKVNSSSYSGNRFVANVAVISLCETT